MVIPIYLMSATVTIRFWMCRLLVPGLMMIMLFLARILPLIMFDLPKMVMTC